MRAPLRMGVFLKRRIQLYLVSGDFHGGCPVARDTAHPDTPPGQRATNLMECGFRPDTARYPYTSTEGGGGLITKAQEKKIKVLFLASWYPHADNPVEGIFVKRHAEAVSRLCDVCVLYIHPAAQQAGNSR